MIDSLASRICIQHGRGRGRERETHDNPRKDFYIFIFLGQEDHEMDLT